MLKLRELQEVSGETQEANLTLTITLTLTLTR